MQWGIRLLAVAITLFACASTAHAAMPGMNGEIAFVRDQPDGTGEIWKMKADGSGETRLTDNAYYDEGPAWSPDGTKLTYACDNFADLCLMKADGTDLGCCYWGTSQELFDPDWSPDGTQVTFESAERYCDDSGDCFYQPDVVKVSISGAGFQNLTGPGNGGEFTPSWSPRGDRIAYDGQGGLTTIRPDGTGRAPLGLCCYQPDWSPDGTKIAYYHPSDGIHIANADGSADTPLTSGGAPAWSPDGRKVAFVSSDGDAEIFVINADGSGRTQITHNAAPDSQPHWQPLPYPGYARPKGATPVFASLVPAYKPCFASNRQHGPPLAFGSCAPPQRLPSQLTIGTSDANGQTAKSIGSVSLYVQTGDPTTPADEADVVLATDITDVRLASDLSDYNGAVQARIGLRITDRGGADPQTLTSTPLSVRVSCAPTPDPTIGARCASTTTADALVPGIASERSRSIWALDQIKLLDGDGAPFAVQGVFVP